MPHNPSLCFVTSLNAYRGEEPEKARRRLLDIFTRARRHERHPAHSRYRHGQRRRERTRIQLDDRIGEGTYIMHACLHNAYRFTDFRFASASHHAICLAKSANQGFLQSHFNPFYIWCFLLKAPRPDQDSNRQGYQSSYQHLRPHSDRPSESGLGDSLPSAKPRYLKPRRPSLPPP